CTILSGYDTNVGLSDDYW
nr:immunoglobulin heavy chain junction region [Macaca mulatta]MOX92996.1 immunoglobulin heavy chain junction region [Macaca mulatta]MOX93703.1 immunoglobulin heavy chain junction region [Macaca mulatta]MOX94434.1 immunoglobulin heavy chain junction region [Macaca mulatta]MOX94628.1 immunoglobulin heavy chain junction region [Macaca mulatta]